MTKCLDLALSAKNCPSDGCPEHFFNHMDEFNDYGNKAYAKALKTINRNKGTWRESVAEASLTKSKGENEKVLKNIQKVYPNAYLITTIYACKHGNILYQDSIRFDSIPKCKENELEEKLKKCIPKKLLKNKNRPLSSYFMRPGQD